jgi:hypothetical protein
MAPTQAKSGLFVGINKGHIVTKREVPLRPSDRKGVRISVPKPPIYRFFRFVISSAGLIQFKELSLPVMSMLRVSRVDLC